MQLVRALDRSCGTECNFRLVHPMIPIHMMISSPQISLRILESLKDIVEQDVKDNHVMIYMKGDLERPQCGFSVE
ncbi:hypothetical protein Ccrd_004940 [Cynara cardunculus var. scolymus]|uniref:Uncharacterized protein n=1 Tax=Cynara cardunculus var. scolymus TaxID=59895 RepID=A0A118JVG0_CYNCS|nr:hypothetical protein Ccrd_004940 [Cynara cardunculus var. scolymus]